MTLLLLLVACQGEVVTGPETVASVVLEFPAGKVIDPKLAGAPVLPLHATVAEAARAEDCALSVVLVDRGGAARTWTHAVTTGTDWAEDWDGLRDDGLPFDPGPVDLQATVTCAGGARGSATDMLHVVRLGLVEVDLAAADDGGHTPVAFHKRSAWEPGVTVIEETLPEYRVRTTGRLADLDLDDGTPRPAVAPWENPDWPPWDDDPAAVDHNLPAAYVAGSRVRLVATGGATAVSPTTGFPVAALGSAERLEDAAPPLRLLPDGLAPEDEDALFVPTAAAAFTSEPLPDTLGRDDLEVTWRWAALGEAGWLPVPGYLTTRHRVYRLAGAPALRDGTDLGYAPDVPWIGVLEDLEPALRDLPADVDAVLDAVRDALHTDPYLVYDPSDGSYSDYEGSYMYWDYIVSDLSTWLDRGDGLHLYCHSVSCLLSTLSGHWGVDAPQIVLGVGFTTNLLRAAGTTTWGRWSFNSHSVVTPDGGATIWDASVEMDGDDDPYSDPVTPLAPRGLPGEEYLWRLTYNDIGIINQGLCYVQ